MTDIDEAVVNGTISALTLTLERATARLATEEEEYNAKRDRMVTVAHQRGNDNSIGEALDDLLEEFGLPRRPQRAYLRCVLMVNAPVNQSGDTIMTDTNQYVYRNDQVRVSWPVVADHVGNLREGDTCLCDNADETIRGWMVAYYNEAASRTMRFQIGTNYCGIDDCPNRAGMQYPDVSHAARVDWTTKPIHAVAAADPAAVPERTPVAGETWYMVGNDTYGTSSRDGEAVTITRYENDRSIYVNRVSRGTGWVLHREHIRPTA